MLQISENEISENAICYHTAPAPVLPACVELATAADVPVGVHLDHVSDACLTDDLLVLSARMLCRRSWWMPPSCPMRTTSPRRPAAPGAGLWVEAELGEIGGKGGAHTPGVRTDARAVAAFMAATEVDALRSRWVPNTR